MTSLQKLKKQVELIQRVANIEKLTVAWLGKDGTVNHQGKVFSQKEFEEWSKREGYTKVLLVLWSKMPRKGGG